MVINVTAATGQLGRKVVRELLDSSDEIVATVRSPDQATDLANRDVEIRRGDYDEPESLHNAFRSTDVLLLIPSIAPVERRVQQHFNALQAAKEAGVTRVVFAGFMAAEPNSKFHIAPYLLYAESKLRLSGLDWTILRDGMYLDPVADWIPDLVQMGRLPYPVDHGRVAYICRDDLARALAAACVGNSHSRELYKLTGPEAISMPELAEAISEATKKPIKFETVTEQEFVEICQAGNESEEMIQTLLSMYRAVENGEFEEVTTDVAMLTGKEPMPIHQFLESRLEV
ncbi:MAG: SDR family NAD(P)-dependent oxidoreductase [Planctomycetota bacterium]|nr:MAG: SDR family NAD(P)-dependent oxidoreductase [Planctomycetota bacterium]REJ92090.1 MAG: SDR family NAD(P)-dependent oxidoreductase [Planctomycetota bacterium]REK28626.1 MAG: SDR family NAD(P)-dependent oxidoreductase [Planctomycetota bacterium]REK39240.1 MAG: SDR family NAD(P)-dependent oxidoreductase [Planctomycetota bacterium]